MALYFFLGFYVFFSDQIFYMYFMFNLCTEFTVSGKKRFILEIPASVNIKKNLVFFIKWSRSFHEISKSLEISVFVRP